MRIIVPIVLAALACACTSSAIPGTRLTAEQKRICLDERDAEGRAVINWSAYNVGCLEYGLPERMHGVWYWGFEESSFLKDARTVGLTRDIRWEDRPEYEAHLTFRDNGELEKVAMPEARGGCALAVYLEFIGRRAVRDYSKRGRGLSEEVEVIQVEKVLDSKFVGFVSKTVKGRPYTSC